jgi:hypothetical protein
MALQQEVTLGLRFDPLGDHLQTQVPGDGQGGGGDGRILRVSRQILHEGAVDLEPRDRQALEVDQAGVARAEVVQGQPQPQAAQPL